MLRSELERGAHHRHARFLEWTPEGPLAYNPYAKGGDTEIADKALAGETFTEPHYLRQAQRYLGHAIRVMHAANVTVTPVSLMAHLSPRQLEVTSRTLEPKNAGAVESYLDSLGERQKRELAGIRDRLSILAESDTRRWLNPTDKDTALDLRAAVNARAVVYFRLDADRRALLSQMLGAAIIADLVTLVAGGQTRPVATVVLIDEFAAVAAEQVSRLFARSRSAGVSLILAAQELADIKSIREGLCEQILGNIETLIAHRQSVPESAELIANMASTRPAWITTQQTNENPIGAGPSGKGARRRGYEYQLHPSAIKQLPVGHAAVLTPAQHNHQQSHASTTHTRPTSEHPPNPRHPHHTAPRTRRAAATSRPGRSSALGEDQLGLRRRTHRHTALHPRRRSHPLHPNHARSLAARPVSHAHPR